MAAKSRAPLYLGVAAAGGVGYYLYSAGGNPKLAEKKAETDAARLSAKVKSELPGREKEAKQKGEEWAQRAGTKVDSSIDEAKSRLSQGEAKLDQYRKETGSELQKKIDEADRKIEKKAAEAKSGISSWFK